MAAFNKFDQFVEDLAHGVHDLKTGSSDVFRVLLTNSPPSAGDTFVDTTGSVCLFGPISGAQEIPAGNGYTKLGISGGTITGSQSSGVFTFILGTDPLWTCVTAPLGPFRYAVLYNNSKGTAATRPLIGWWDYLVQITLSIGDTFTVDLSQVSGVLTLQ